MDSNPKFDTKASRLILFQIDRYGRQWLVEVGLHQYQPVHSVQAFFYNLRIVLQHIQVFARQTYLDRINCIAIALLFEADTGIRKIIDVFRRILVQQFHGSLHTRRVHNELGIVGAGYLGGVCRLETGKRTSLK